MPCHFACAIACTRVHTCEQQIAHDRLQSQIGAHKRVLVTENFDFVIGEVLALSFILCTLEC